VLFAAAGVDPSAGLLLNTTLPFQPEPLGEHLSGVQLRSTVLLEQAWEQLKTLEQQYLRTPFFKDVYGEELGILPGLDDALALNALRQWSRNGQYDLIVFDGPATPELLRLWAIPDVLSWYVRRFERVLSSSDLGRTLSPFIQPLATAILSVGFSSDTASRSASAVNDQIEQGRQALADPQQIAAYLVTTADPLAIAAARTYWGAAQQAGLIVGGVLLNRGTLPNAVGESFQPLPLNFVPEAATAWDLLEAAMPDPAQLDAAPRPLTIDVAAKQISLFLPSFDKKQVRLTQYGKEITIEAGDQRRNIILPEALKGCSVAGAKFQDQRLILSLQ
jgi:arsenite-transporting ATPase